MEGNAGGRVMIVNTNTRTEIDFSANDLSEAMQHYAKAQIMENHSEDIRSGRQVIFAVSVHEGDNSARLTITSLR